MSPNNHNTTEQRERAFAAHLMNETTQRIATRQGLSAGAAKVAGIAVAGMVIAGIAISTGTVNAAIQLAARVW